jgi:hypothetical protein
MRTVIAEHIVSGFQSRTDTGGNGLLARIEMHRANNSAFQNRFYEALFAESDANHCPIETDEELR